MNEPITTIRLDKWLWFARFFKTRTLASAHVKARKVRLNGTVVSKASVLVKIGDTLTFPKADHIKVIEITACGTRRGPFAEAQTLYIDHSPSQDDHQKNALNDPKAAPTPSREKGMGRPTKADRRALDKLQQGHG